ncbi:tetratricopeptide repeat protein [Calothrix sp. UHCC 0171]|uniref:tetratricopeptide repeat protein n=1 Tax=Calothrix sp. UHCC 0171 TaxID=3110245 RepID=UPI002B2190E5|nr:tetratricopeptide repeat protein [Calothrix sp. UHCC 0171]MEA5570808.1 tetratricopeptide repeat protein [Calothrix sp. UHCC 0171]
MSDSLSLRDKYLALIDEIVAATLQGKISSAEQVYQMLLKGVTTDTGEIFEMLLSDRLNSTQQLVNSEKDELKQAKATRSLRAIKTIQTQWLRAEEENKTRGAMAAAIREITTSAPEEQLGVFLRVIDQNHKNPLNLQQIQQLAKSLNQYAQADSNLQQIANGVIRGAASWQRLQEHLVSWMYERQDTIGFGGVPGDSGPWATWAKQVKSEFPEALFRTLAREESVIEFAERQRNFNMGDWVEVAIILQYIQRGLVNWFDQQPYNIKAGSKLSISTFLTFAVIWSYLAIGLRAIANIYGDASSQVMLQILRTFSQKQYFPLYGGLFASFSGSYLRNALDYLDEPLRTAAGTQEKARILTLLGYSQRAMGQYARAKGFHQQALEIARNAGDRSCEIANLNHLSRTCVEERDYNEAIDYSQRALIFSRQSGDKTGEANALVNLGYSEVMTAQQREDATAETYEMAINYLQQGLKLSEQLGDIQSKALCLSSLGIAYQVVGESQKAIQNLESAFNTAQLCGDLYLQGLNLANLAETNYSLANFERAVYTGCLGMYLLNQISSREWRKPASLLAILKGQLGEERFQTALQSNRQKMIAVIGVDGYDYIPQLLEIFRNEM